MGKGFIDIQNNGWMGTGFSEEGLTVEKIAAITRDMAARGTAAYCPTLMTSSEEIYRWNLPVLSEAMDEPEAGAHILGIDMEGPFISPEDGAVGAHPREHVREPDCAAFDRLQEWAGGKIKTLTVAPERPGSEELIRHVAGQGVLVSLGIIWPAMGTWSGPWPPAQASATTSATAFPT